jgi:hypothetical protein
MSQEVLKINKIVSSNKNDILTSERVQNLKQNAQFSMEYNQK